MSARRLVAGLLSMALAVSCVAGDDRTPLGSLGGDGHTGVIHPPCEEGTQKTCTVTLSEHNGVLSCVHGVSTCVDGTWGACEGEPNSEAKSQHAPLSLSTSKQCVDNPCDPTCQVFEEVPAGGTLPPPAYGWSGGTLEDYPDGLTEPCGHGVDCQFNTYCKDPLSGTCSHSKCSTGAALAQGCDTCVDEICAADPTCCGPPEPPPLPAHTCDHSYCEEGKRLKKNCDPCVKKVCDLNPNCCKKKKDWDAACIALVEDPVLGCGIDCNPPAPPVGHAWDASCVEKVGTLCDAHCPANGCAHEVCTLGEPLDASCDSCASTVCSDPATAYCCQDSGAWDATCVAAAESACGATCATPPPSGGQCLPWLPGQTDPGCAAGIDLSVGPPCKHTVPICNHGAVEAPAGLRLVHFPKGSDQFGSCTPDQSIPSMKECFTDAPIPPGECVTVTSCNGLGQDAEIMINPPGPAEVAECSCVDNWAMYTPSVKCQEPACSGASSSAATSSKVDIIIAIDTSGSMTAEVMGVQDAINNDFSAIIGASGLDYRVIMLADHGNVNQSNRICVKSPLGGSDCSPVPSKPAENAPIFYHYDTRVGSHDAWCKLMDGFDGSVPDDSGRHPNGYQELLRPDAFKIFLVITDDSSSCSCWGSNCSSYDSDETVAGGTSAAAKFDAELMAMSPTHFGTPGNRGYQFYTIASLDYNAPNTAPYLPTDPIITDECPLSAGVSTGHQAMSILTGGLRFPSCDQTLFGPVFQGIAQGVIASARISCDYNLPNQGNFNPNAAALTYTPGDGSGDQTIALVDGPGSCSMGGMEAYYDDPFNPSKLHFCPDTCDTVKLDDSGAVNVSIGCPVGAYTVRETYEAECPDKQTPQWSLFTYDSETPSNSTITFEVRSADSEAELTTPAIPLATAQASPDTQVCSPFGPSPDCPIDLFEVLGEKDAQRKVLELVVTQTPSSDSIAPTLNSWEVQYSCVDLL